jgi:hypothetical protein
MRQTRLDEQGRGTSAMSNRIEAIRESTFNSHRETKATAPVLAILLVNRGFSRTNGKPVVTLITS